MTDICYTPQGCCPNLNISLDDFICLIRQLMPPSQLWDKNKFPPNKNVAFVDAMAAAIHKTYVRIIDVTRELDPCTADKTLELWAKRFGLDKHCDIEVCPTQLSQEVNRLVLAMRVCFHEKMRYSGILNQANLKKFALEFGVDIKIIQPSWTYGGNQCPACITSDGCAYTINSKDRCRFVFWENQVLDGDCFYTSHSKENCGEATNGSLPFTSNDYVQFKPEFLIKLCPINYNPDLNCLNWQSFPRIATEDMVFHPLAGCSSPSTPLNFRPLFEAFKCFLKEIFPPHYKICIENGCLGSC